MIVAQQPIIQHTILDVSILTYPFMWDMVTTSSVLVWLDKQPLHEGVHFSLGQITDHGGDVTLHTTPVLGSIITIARITPISQQTSYNRGSSFNVHSLSTQLDKTVMNIQEVDSSQGQAVIFVKAELATMDIRITDNTANIASNTTRLATAEQNITTNTTGISLLDSRVTANETDIITNKNVSSDRDVALGIRIDACEVVDTMQTTQITALEFDSAGLIVWKDSVVTPELSDHEIRILNNKAEVDRIDPIVASNEIRITAIESGSVPPGGIQPIMDAIAVVDQKTIVNTQNITHNTNEMTTYKPVILANQSAIATADLPAMKSAVTANTADVAANNTKIIALQNKDISLTTSVNDLNIELAATNIYLSNVTNNSTSNTGRITVNEAAILALEQATPVIPPDQQVLGQLPNNKRLIENQHCDTLPEGYWIQDDGTKAVLGRGYPAVALGGTCLLLVEKAGVGNVQTMTTYFGGRFLRFSTTSTMYGEWAHIGGATNPMPAGIISGTGTATDPWQYPESTQFDLKFTKVGGYYAHNYKDTGYIGMDYSFCMVFNDLSGMTYKPAGAVVQVSNIIYSSITTHERVLPYYTWYEDQAMTIICRQTQTYIYGTRY